MTSTSSLSMVAVFSFIAIQTSASATELRITYAPANLSGMYKAIADEFVKEYPGNTVSLQGYASYADLMQQTLRDGIAGALPDVSHQGLNFIRVYADRKMATELDAFVRDDPDWAGRGREASMARVGQINEITYAIPFSISTQNIFFNLDLVEKAGADPKRLPTTWPGIIALAKTINSIGGGVSGLYFDYGANSALAFQTLVFSQGGAMMTANDSDIAFDGSAGQWAMNLLQQFGEAGQVDMTRDNARQAFVSGKLGIYQNTSSNLGNFDKQIEKRFRYAMTPVPLAQGGQLPASGNGMVVFSKGEEKQKAAWNYVKFASGPRGQKIMATMTGYVPVNSSVRRDPEMAKFYNDNPNYAVPLDQIASLTAWYAFPGKNGPKISEMIIEKMRNVVTLQTSPKQALGEAATEARELLKPGM